MKQNIHLAIDAAVYTSYVHIVGKGNVTRSIEDHMRTVTNATTGDYNREILSLEVESLTEKHKKLSTELQQKSELLEHLREVAEQKKLAELKADQDAYENAAKCQVCGSLESAKWHQFSIGKICNACFLQSDAKQVAYWTTKKGDMDGQVKF